MHNKPVHKTDITSNKDKASGSSQLKIIGSTKFIRKTKTQSISEVNNKEVSNKYSPEKSIVNVEEKTCKVAHDGGVQKESARNHL